LGVKLAHMHLNGKSENGMYGFSRPTHCGATVSMAFVLPTRIHALRSRVGRGVSGSMFGRKRRAGVSAYSQQVKTQSLQMLLEYEVDFVPGIGPKKDESESGQRWPFSYVRQGQDSG
jgi:hypothetical protein